MIRELDRGTATRREHVKRIDGRLSALKGKHFSNGLVSLTLLSTFSGKRGLQWVSE